MRIILSGSNPYVAHSHFKETGLELANREKIISEMTKTRPRNLVYLCWCLVWLESQFVKITFLDEGVEDFDIKEIQDLLKEVDATNSNDKGVM